MVKKLLFLCFLILPLAGFGSDYFWIGGSGYWHDINHWATSSGGSLLHSVVPSPTDNVIFDQNSFSASGQYIVLPAGIATCRDLRCVNISDTVSITPVMGSSLKVYGSFLLNRKLTLGIFPIYFEATTLNHHINCDSLELNNFLYFDGIGGSWYLDGPLKGNAIDVNFYNGAFYSQGNPISIRNLYSSYNFSRTLNITSSACTILGSVSIKTDNLSLSAGGSTFNMLSNNAQFLLSGSNFVNFNDVNFKGTQGLLSTITGGFHDIEFLGVGDIQGHFEFNILTMASDGNLAGTFTGHKWKLTENKNYEFMMSSVMTILDSIITDATCYTYVNIYSISTGTIVSSVPITIQYVTLKNMTGLGGGTFVANNSLDLGGNTGWTIIAPPLATHYWVGGQGKWNDSLHWSYTSGGPPGACVPTPSDDVIFDHNSFFSSDTVFIDSEFQFCNNMIWTGLGPDKPMFFSVLPAELFIYGSMTLHPNMIVESTAHIHFKATQSGKTITTANHSFDSDFIFDGNGGAWTLLDSFMTTGIIYLDRGSLTSNSNYITCLRWNSGWTFVRELSLGASIVDLSGDDATVWGFSATNLNLNPGTSHIRVNGENAAVKMTGNMQQDYYNITFTDSNSQGLIEMESGALHRLQFCGDADATSISYQIDSMILSPGKVYKLTEGSLFQIMQALVVPGRCTAPIHLRSDSSGFLATIQKSTGAVITEYTILRDIQALGGVTFIANNSIDLGNNPGWTINPLSSHDLYWVGGTGVWSDTMHWSYSSGGTGGACIPTPIDNVFFDQNSNIAHGNVTVDILEAHCHNMIWDNLSEMLEFHGSDPSSVNIWGSLAFDTLSTNMALIPFIFRSQHGGNFVRCEQNVFHRPVIFHSRTGAWDLQDSFRIINQKPLKLISGTLNFQGNYLNIGDFISTYSALRSLDIRSSEIHLNGHWNLWGDTLSFVADSSDIILESIGSTIQNVNGIFNYWNLLGKKYSQVFQDNSWVHFRKAEFHDDAYFNNSHHYDSLIFSQGRAYELSPADTQYVDKLIVPGLCQYPIEISSKISGSTSYFWKDTDTIFATSVVITDNHAVGGAVFMASASKSMGNTNGWFISTSPPRDLYWVNGTGDWSDLNHWSLSSGGTGGECIPTLDDNVFFDTNSFVNFKDTVNVDVSPAECRNMTWIATADTPVFTGFSTNINLHIAGSLVLNPMMEQMYPGSFRFIGQIPGLSVTTNNHPFINHIIFDGTGSWVINDSLLLPNSTLYLVKGNLNTNSKVVQAAYFDSFTSNVRSLSLGSSEFILGPQWRLNMPNFTLNAGSSKIRFINSSPIMVNNGQGVLNFNHVNFEADQGTTQLRANALIPYFRHLSFGANGLVLGEHICDTLVVSPGMEYKLEIGKVQEVINLFWIRGNNCFPISLRSTITGTQARIKKPSGIVSGDYINIRDIEAFGGATFFAGENSTDVSNNLGWIFANNPGYIFGLGNDTTLTLGDTVTLSTVNFNGGPNTTYLWSNGTTGSTLDVTYPGMYYITVTYGGGCTVVDSILVGCYTMLSFIIQGTTCPGGNDGTILVIPNDTATYTYSWSNGDSTDFINNLSAGSYWVYALGSNGCFGKDTAIVPQPPPIILPITDTAFCRGDSLLLDAGQGHLIYIWSNGAGIQSFYINQPGHWWALVMDSLGCWSDTFHVDVAQDTMPVFVLGLDTFICLGSTRLLEAPSGYGNYLWQNGSVSPTLLAQMAGIFWVDVINGACVKRDTVVLFDCPPILDFPNVFTPNGDGYNDDFGPFDQNIIGYEFHVFNRWGTLVFRTTDLNATWDGKQNGIDCPEGVYYFTVSYGEYGSLGRPGGFSKTGTVTLLR